MVSCSPKEHRVIRRGGPIGCAGAGNRLARPDDGCGHRPLLPFAGVVECHRTFPPLRRWQRGIQIRAENTDKTEGARRRLFSNDIWWGEWQEATLGRRRLAACERPVTDLLRTPGSRHHGHRSLRPALQDRWYERREGLTKVALTHDNPLPENPGRLSTPS